MPVSRLLKQYDGQIILDLQGDDSSSKDLLQRWKLSHPGKRCYIIPINSLLEREIFCKNIFSPTDHIRIYLVSHCSAGNEYFSDNNDIDMGYLQLARLLIPFIGNHSVVINLIGCSAGRGIEESPFEQTELSIAAKLHKSLFELSGKDIPVIARTSTVFIWKHYSSPWYRFYEEHLPAGQKQTTDILKTQFSLNENEKSYTNQPGSKIIFSIKRHKKQIRQIKRDGNIYSWKRKVFRELTVLSNYVLTKTTKQPFFINWLNGFNTHGIINVQEYLLNNRKLFIDLYKECYQVSFFGGFFQRNPINDLIEEGNTLLNSSNTLRTACAVQKLKII